jgi:hypothetical protein
MLGLASSDMDEGLAAIRIGAAGQDTYRVQYPARIVHAFESTFWNGYRLVVEYHAATRRVSGTLVDRSSHAEVCRATETLPATVGPFVVDEAGVAQREQAFAATAAGSYRFRLEGFQLHPPQPAAADD